MEREIEVTWGMPFGKTPLVANLEGVLKVLDGGLWELH